MASATIIGLILHITILGVESGVLMLFIIIAFLQPRRAVYLSNQLKKGQVRDVIRGAKRLITKNPKNSDARYLLGCAYLSIGEEKAALTELTIVNQLDNFSPLIDENDFRKKIVVLYKKFDQPEEALKEYIILAKTNLDIAEYPYQAGLLFEARGNFPIALECYQKTVGLDDNYLDAHFRLGMLYYQNKDRSSARKHFDSVLRLDSYSAAANYYLGNIKRSNRDYLGAIPNFNISLRSKQYKVQSLTERGICYYYCDQIQVAISDLKQVIQLASENDIEELLQARYFLASCYEIERMMEAAIDQWELINSVRPSFPNVAEKLLKYRDLRSSDQLKDYMTVSSEKFEKVCSLAAENLGFKVQSVYSFSNGCRILASEASLKWGETKNIMRLIEFQRVTDQIEEAPVRGLYERMKSDNAQRAFFFTSSGFNSQAYDFADTRPVRLYGRDELQQLLSNCLGFLEKKLV